MGSTSRRRKAVFVPGSKWLFLNSTCTIHAISELWLARLAQQKRLQSPMQLCVLYWQLCSSVIPWILLQVSERAVQLFWKAGFKLHRTSSGVIWPLGGFLKVEDAQELSVSAAGACQKRLLDLYGWVESRGEEGEGLRGETAEEIQMKIQLNRRHARFKAALTLCSGLLMSLDFNTKCNKWRRHQRRK